jgi:hypothetical protein
MDAWVRGLGLHKQRCVDAPSLSSALFGVISAGTSQSLNGEAQRSLRAHVSLIASTLPNILTFAQTDCIPGPAALVASSELPLKSRGFQNDRGQSTALWQALRAAPENAHRSRAAPHLRRLSRQLTEGFQHRIALERLDDPAFVTGETRLRRRRGNGV